MKKIYTTILLLLLGYTSQAQTDPDLLGQWFLHYVETSGSTMYVPTGNVIPVNFTNPGSFDSASGDSTCNSFTAEYALSNSNASININFFTQTLVMCNGDTFEPVYLGILGNDTTNFFDYTINLTDESLTMIDLLGEKLVYGRQVLSTESIDATENSLKLYPNPVKNLLYISGSSVDSSTTYAIYSMVGTEIITEKTIANTNVDVSNLKAGVYFLKIAQKGKTYMRKFIKV
ncbi:T9SS type A sorting domain-containing protein [Kordia sp. YSTF-M3]|uniref:T9SS type A sorting domain-containing protein n=1 Tax=Kordia aestuariivivens TaxID=2759037 RepID=A0ABR7Q862_9FLAO|nr:T9SS type A sorting domain-containing protein [Kordia aestuariivivens]MBC8754717.1 T9SS type A sorting domain-containing protein [Kordia aestuariivivens]